MAKGQNGDTKMAKNRVKTATGENGESQNGDKPCNECDFVCLCGLQWGPVTITDR